MKKRARYKYKTLAAGIGPAKNDGLEERYRAVKFLTPVPTKIIVGIDKFMPFSQVTNVTGKIFFLGTNNQCAISM